MAKTVRDVIYNEYAAHLLIDDKFASDLNEKLTIEEMNEVLSRFVVSDSAEIGVDGHLRRELRTISREEYEAIEKDCL